MNKQLVDELLAMRDIGVRVSEKTIQHAQTDNLQEYAGISIGELASLFCELYND